jgi:sensor histidine kinase YesM
MLTLRGHGPKHLLLANHDFRVVVQVVEKGQAIKDSMSLSDQEKHEGTNVGIDQIKERVQHVASAVGQATKDDDE